MTGLLLLSLQPCYIVVSISEYIVYHSARPNITCLVSSKNSIINYLGYSLVRLGKGWAGDGGRSDRSQEIKERRRNIIEGLVSGPMVIQVCESPRKNFTQTPSEKCISQLRPPGVQCISLSEQPHTPGETLFLLGLDQPYFSKSYLLRSKVFSFYLDTVFQ